MRLTFDARSHSAEMLRDATAGYLQAVPSAMIFVRDDHGSHNPAEALRMEDFALGTALLLWLLTQDD